MIISGWQPISLSSTEVYSVEVRDVPFRRSLNWMTARELRTLVFEICSVLTSVHTPS